MLLRAPALTVVASLAALCVAGVVAAPPASARSRVDAVAGTYIPVQPARIADTRIGLGGPAPSAHGTLTVQVTGRGGIPASGISAVYLNLTVVAPPANGFLTAYPAGSSRPVTTNASFTAGRTSATRVLAQVSTSGKVAIYNGSVGRVDLVVDVSGYYVDGAPSSGGAYQPVPAQRIADTRQNSPTPPPAGRHSVEWDLAGAGGLPDSVGAVVLSLTATGATAAGAITVYPADGRPRPTTSNLNFVAGRTVTDLVVMRVSGDRGIRLYNSSAHPVQLIADVVGYFLPGAAQQPGALHVSSPQRLVDTRSDANHPVVAARGTLALQVAGSWSVAPSGVSAVLLNVTVTAPQAAGYLTVYASGGSRPATSDVNFGAADTVSNLVVAPVGADGVVDFVNASSGKTHVIVDVFGYTSSQPDPWTTPELPGGSDADLNGISCPSTSSCIAVGAWYPGGPAAGGALIETLADGVWTRSKQSAPGANVSRALAAVACTSPTHCVAVGNDTDGSTVQPVAETLSGGTWTAVELPLPGDPGQSKHGTLAGISCTSATACVAVGAYTNGSMRSALVETLRGTTWTAQDVTPANAGYADLDAVSCWSATACVAGGSRIPRAHPEDAPSALIETLSGHRWTPDRTISAQDAAQAWTWNGVSCPAPGTCTAVSSFGLAAYLSGSTWTTGPMPEGMVSISCATATQCTAVGNYLALVGGTPAELQPEVAVRNGTTWTSLGLPRPFGGGAFSSISCPTPDGCVAAGSAFDPKVPADIFPPVPLIETEQPS